MTNKFVFLLLFCKPNPTILFDSFQLLIAELEYKKEEEEEEEKEKKEEEENCLKAN